MASRLHCCGPQSKLDSSGRDPFFPRGGVTSDNLARRVCCRHGVAVATKLSTNVLVQQLSLVAKDLARFWHWFQPSWLGHM